MSGHSKWSTIRHKKSKVDAQRGRIFTKLIKEITVAARDGGGDESANPRLRTAIQNARIANMPNDNIERAVKKGTGELPGVHYEEVMYEAFGTDGVAILVESLTDNKNRTTSEIRHLLTKHGGNMGGVGSVAWMFEKKGEVIIEDTEITEDQLMEIVIDSAEDIETLDGAFRIVTPVETFQALKETLENAKLAIKEAALTMIPTTTKPVEGKTAETVLKLLTILEEHDDVQNVYANFDIDDTVMEAFSQNE